MGYRRPREKRLCPDLVCEPTAKRKGIRIGKSMTTTLNGYATTLVR